MKSLCLATLLAISMDYQAVAVVAHSQISTRYKLNPYTITMGATIPTTTMAITITPECCDTVVGITTGRTV